MKDFLEVINGIKYIENTPMSKYCSFKAGGAADVLCEPQNEEELARVLKAVSEMAIPFYMMGNGSNILVKDGGFRGVIIKIAEGFDAIKIDGETITAGAGALLTAVSRAAAREALTGMEFASGIPGSLGGAVYMNAGAYDGEMKNIVTSITAVSENGSEIREIPVEDLDLSYRHSALMENGYVVTKVTLKLEKGDADAIKAKIADLTERRVTKQPVKYPSAGSFFKRPEGYFAGKLVQDAGLKGLTVGGAQVSELHSGFVINIGGATASDIISLMHMVQGRVMEDFGVMMEPEVRIIGED